MKQKIVITANMSRAPAPTAPEVTYQWHWQRIATVMLLVIFALVIVAYSLLGSVNAEQNDQQPIDSSVAEVVTDSVTDDPQLVDPRIEESDTELDSASAIPVIAAVIENSDIDDLAASASEPEAQITVQEQEVREELPASTTVIPDTNEELVGQEVTVQQTDSFAPSAHVASVALGARIDTDKVSRAVLTREVVDREPVNVFKADVRFNEFTETMAFFSELKNLQGQKVKHVWRYEDEVLASIELDVTSPRYRTFSNKTILPEQVGNWRVDVVDEHGHLLAQKEFRILAE
ncbi:DUF2914 domain-containing protein [Pseudoalteromonas haloplanktis]|uniref:DUF2914 domain-containing protein n=1 Tax=Pseudoalteromonas haloplanktis TaxID=228 RepID=A0ABU1BFD8_PSEHA|nr:DUF2914 domain-containing protein [Pseudoalteromonas haloplanktis]MDQ9092234.1 DUF2914 domain-containing protein [Pseudoalteromonas haloplanktis]